MSRPHSIESIFPAAQQDCLKGDRAWLPWLLVWLGLLCTDPAWAQAPAACAPVGGKDRIARKRASVEATFARREAECQTRFAVTDCVNDAKSQRREALAPLRREGIAIDEAQRKERAARRQQMAVDRAQNAQAVEREVLVRRPAGVDAAASAVRREPAAEAASEARQKAAPKAAPKAATARTPPKRPSEAERSANEAAAEARARARKQAAQAHREAVEQRNAERALRGKQVNPLPVPAPAGAP